MSLDCVPGFKLYIGGAFTLRRTEALKRANITHVVSALRLPLDPNLYKEYNHHVVELDDLEDENIIEHFEASNRFIQGGVDGGGGVLVHCAMGKSRSATLLLAYLLHTRPTLTPTTALALLREGRPFAEPNPGFMEQLELYHRMGCPMGDLDAQPEYQRWCYRKTVDASLARGEAPGVEELTFGDEMPAAGSSPAVADGGDEEAVKAEKEIKQYRCKRCRQQLASTPFLLQHTPRPQSTAKTFSKSPSPPQQPSNQPCAHLFLEQPLSWMRPELEQGKLEGRLECPNARCKTQVGRYAWQGLKCSCGEWVVPGISLGVGKVDGVREKRDGRGGGERGKM